jgi:V8-like Glu-specific endopeptidase
MSGELVDGSGWMEGCMRWMARGAHLFRKGPSRIFALVAAATIFAAIMLVPADGGASGIADRFGHAMRSPTGASETGQFITGVAAVGALFSVHVGKRGQHFCTASVVHSSHGDLAITAAHCVTGQPGTMVFIPGYANGKEPYGVWRVTRVYTTQNWRSTQDANDDVAFLQLSNATDGVPIEDVTGAEQLGTGWPAHTLIQVIGYPDGASLPLWCMNWTKSFTPTQIEFDCGGYTDGTSGAPFLANVSVTTGQGTVIGVIGGYEQGGDIASVSYSVAFGTTVADLYQTAVAGS